MEPFTDRREAITLFEYIRGRDPNQPWPLLPIVTFVGPSGSGKSTLIEYLRFKQCCLPNGHAVLPHAYLDFTLVDAPKNLLSILVALRNQLQQLEDGQGKHLAFPRFDLGASIALATPTEGNLPLLGLEEIQRNLSTGLSFLGPVGEMGHALNNLIPIISPLLVGLKLTAQIPSLQTILQRLERGPGWKWYQTNKADVGLSANTNIRDVLLRLHALSMPGKPGKQGRELLVEQLLPAAFLADLRDALEKSTIPRAWSKTANVVLFLDGFEALLDNPNNIGIRLLQMLALTELHKIGKTGPLLLVIGSRRRLFEPIGSNQSRSLEEMIVVQDGRSAYERWYQQLPRERRFLQLRDLYLEILLPDFGLTETHAYLMQFSNQRKQTFTYDGLVEPIFTATHGHPLSLALTAFAMWNANTNGHIMKPEEFMQAFVPLEVAPGHENKTVGSYLLSLFLEQLTEAERDELIFCVVPRTLDVATIQVVLQLQSDTKARDRWRRYGNLNFVRSIGDESIVFHPIVRNLLLRQLVPDHNPESDYYRVHARLREHFRERSVKLMPHAQKRQEEQPQIEEAYHALALGDPEPAIQFALSFQYSHLDIWERLLEAVEQAPTGLILPDIEQRAADALHRTMQHNNVLDSVTAIILYTWLHKAVTVESSVLD